MNEREKEQIKRNRKRMRILLGVCMLAALGAAALMAFGARRENGVIMFAAMLLMAASLAVQIVGTRRMNEHLEQEAEQALDEVETMIASVETDPLAPGAAPSDLIVMGYPTDVLYQVVPGPQELHFVRLGWGEGLSDKAIDRLLEPGGSDADIRAQMEKGFSVPWRDIEQVDVTFKRCVSTQTANFGIFSLHSGGKRKRFILLSRDEALDTPERIRAFFAPASGAYTADTKKYDRAQDELREDREFAALQEEPERDPALVKKLLLLRLLLPAAQVVVGGAWRFLGVPYNLFAGLLAGLTLLPPLLVALFPRIFSVSMLLELKRGEREAQPGTVDLSYANFVGGFFLMAGAMADFNVQNWLWLLGVTVLFSVVLAMLMTRTLKLRKIWMRRALLTMLLMMLSVGLVLELNYLLDFREPKVERAAIADMYVSGGRSTSYDLVFNGVQEPVSVSKEMYDSLEPGDTVILAEYAGSLGVRYVEAWTVADWNAQDRM